MKSKLACSGLENTEETLTFPRPPGYNKRIEAKSGAMQ